MARFVPVAALAVVLAGCVGPSSGPRVDVVPKGRWMSRVEPLSADGEAVEAEVASLGGTILIGRAGHGHWIQQPSGSWARRE